MGALCCHGSGLLNAPCCGLLCVSSQRATKRKGVFRYPIYPWTEVLQCTLLALVALYRPFSFDSASAPVILNTIPCNCLAFTYKKAKRSSGTPCFFWVVCWFRFGPMQLVQ